MSFRWSFFPEPAHQEPLPEPAYREPLPKRPNRNAWRAPEHGKLTKDMIRDYPRDDLGRKIEGRERELVADCRPEILRPKRRPIYL